MGLEPYYLYRQKNMSGNFENVGYAAPGKAGIYNILIMEEKQTILALGAGAITKRVFPGGRIERCDFTAATTGELSSDVARRLEAEMPARRARALALTAVRETFEETGLLLASPAPAASVAGPWREFRAVGALPDLAALSYIARAITPPGRSRRFDARFFLADAGHIIGDLDDFSRASDELGHLHWVPLGQARRLNLPFITEVVLGEVDALLQRGGQPASVPFFDNSTAEPRFWRL